jgi:hypothetical protein
MAEGAETRWQQARGSRELLERLLERSLERSLERGLDWISSRMNSGSAVD